MSKPKILIVDDDLNHGRMLATVLADWGYECDHAPGGNEALEMLSAREPDLVLLDMRMPEMNGLETLDKIHERLPALPVIMMTAYSDIGDAVQAMKHGAFDYLAKPLDLEKLKFILDNARRGKVSLKTEIQEEGILAKILGNSDPVLKMKDMIKKMAPAEATVLIQGDSGTGKELAARALHDYSARAKGPFIAINCGAMTGPLLASELFGHEKGSFTGADRKHDGLFREASGGTIFLDEIGEMPLDLQVTLLRVIQEKEVLSIGGKRPVPINCRIIAATNRNLAEEVKSGCFREDLFYRLNVLTLTLPSLKERKEDISMLANHFAREFAKRNNKEFTSITADALKLLTSYDWPGNIRELENIMERAIILMPGEFIGVNELPEHINARGERPNQILTNTDSASPETLEEIERKVILHTLEQMGNNKSEAAKILGISRKTLHAKLNRYNRE